MNDPTGNAAEHTLEGGVARAVDRLQELDTLPVEGHVEVFERVQAVLDQTLTHADPDDEHTNEPH
jgi:hypothetical protein